MRSRSENVFLRARDVVQGLGKIIKIDLIVGALSVATSSLLCIVFVVAVVFGVAVVFAVAVVFFFCYGQQRSQKHTPIAPPPCAL